MHDGNNTTIPILQYLLIEMFLTGIACALKYTRFLERAATPVKTVSYVVFVCFFKCNPNLVHQIN